MGGDYQVAIRATDEHGAATVVTYPIKVVDNAYPQVQANALAPAFLGVAFEYELTVTDPNAGDTIEVTLNDEAVAAGMTIVDPDPQGATPNVWTLSWSDPGPVDHVGVPVKIYVKDNHGAQVTVSFPLRVYDPNDSQLAAGEPARQHGRNPLGSRIRIPGDRRESPW